MIEVDSYSYTI